eukprot:TRINITY_DN1704_c0_g1_i3.p4 TRINITY_DN1704_c0_g1~~TRINITY_DN1704_c0_g1_i3.p4  ORF type:complete len:154 (+),score=40.32 TRINITY_DN1704_c0_g1_i3:551-1012(+)
MAVYPESLAAVEEVIIGPPEARCEEAGLPYMDAAALNRLTGVPSGGQGSGLSPGGFPSPLRSRQPGPAGPGDIFPGDDAAAKNAPSSPLPTSTPGLSLGQAGRTPPKRRASAPPASASGAPLPLCSMGRRRRRVPTFPFASTSSPPKSSSRAL